MHPKFKEFLKNLGIILLIASAFVGMGAAIYFPCHYLGLWGVTFIIGYWFVGMAASMTWNSDDEDGW